MLLECFLYVGGKVAIKVERENFSEKSQDQILQRSDFRFLLSNPDPEKSICLAGGLLSGAVELISGSVVEPASNRDVNSCDLFVAVNPDDATLESAFSSLKPGGDFYAEWTVNQFTKPAVIEERLSKFGFESVFLYLPKPDPSKSIPKVWIPLDAPGAIEFLTKANTQISRKRFLEWLGKSVRRLSWKLFPQPFLSYPWLLSSGLKKFSICSICSKPGEKLTANKLAGIPVKALKDCLSVENDLVSPRVRIRNNRNEVGYKERDRLSVLMITGGIDELYKILLIVFYGLNYDPSLVVKISRTEESASQLNMESNVLKTINEKYKNIEGIPRILFSNHTTDAHVNVQTVINGALLASVLNKDSFPELARLTTLWLVELAKSTKTRPPEDWREKMVHSVLSDINSSAAKIIDSHFMDQTIHILGDFNIPCLVCEHRDFGPQNILVDSESKLGVIDWEFSRLHGIPALDLIFFLTRAGFILRGAPKSITYGDCYREMLDPDTFTGGVFRDCLDYYTSALDIPGSEIPSLRLMTWIVHYFWRMFGDKRYTPEPGHRESSINHWTLTLWKEELSISGLSE